MPVILRNGEKVTPRYRNRSRVIDKRYRAARVSKR